MLRFLAVFLTVLVFCEPSGPGAGRLVCYVKERAEGLGLCTHVVFNGEERGNRLDSVLKGIRSDNPKLKIILRINEHDKDIPSLLQSKFVQGLELHEAHKTLNRSRIVETVQATRSALTKQGGGPLLLALPANPELLAKYYDFSTLVKIADLMMVETHALGLVPKMTFHPSRLSGLWDMMNIDSVVDLAIGLGVPASKIVISLPATALQFSLTNQTLSTPGSPTVDDQPEEISQTQLCQALGKGRWTLERDQDLSGPYAFKNTTWISFEDSTSVDVKGKYARVRGLAGLALHDADQDLATPCGDTLKNSLAKVLNSQSRAPRALVLRSLEHDILSSPSAPARALDALQLSPYRITQVVDSDGVIHSIREDTRTEFSCSRQGYFVHPRSCARFYRCVKFDQLSPEYTVFEFDCPAGLAFDARYEVCVWPGSLPHSQACPGSSEIAPVPQTRFVCPEHEGYYADPENCRWFFACLDHGKAPLSAYEFRCPFGLGFDAQKLKCDWPWLVPACGHIARYEAEVHGYSGAALTGAAGFHGQTADSVNIAAHQSLVSGADVNNLVGIQNGFLSQADALDGNFIASQEYANAAQDDAAAYANAAAHTNAAAQSNAAAHAHAVAQANAAAHSNGFISELGLQGQNGGFVQPKNYEEKYTSGSLILDDYRFPTHKTSNGHNVASVSSNRYSANSHLGKSYQSGTEIQDNSGAYVHDPSGDFGVPYKHLDSPAVPYIHDGSAYKQTNDYNDYDKSIQGSYGGKYAQDNSGQYQYENRASYDANNNGAYKADYAGSYANDYSGSYANDDSGKYVAGIYRTDGDGLYAGYNAGQSGNIQQYNSYSNANTDYLNGGQAYTGGSHTLTAGAVSVGLVGKTTLVDDLSHNNYQHNNNNGYSLLGPQYYDQGVSVTHVGSEISHHGSNLGYVTTPTTSGIPTTATPIAVTTAIPFGYKTSHVEVQPKTSIKEIFGYSQPAITHIQPTVVHVKQFAPKVEITDYNQAFDYQHHSQNNYNGVGVTKVSDKTVSEGYNYAKPTVNFEDGNTYTTAAPVAKEGYGYPQPAVKFEEGVSTHVIAPVTKYLPQVINHKTIDNSEIKYDFSPQIAVKEPFKKAIAYTTGAPSITYAPTAHAFSHQTIHKVEVPKINFEVNNGFEYEQPAVQYETPVEYSTARPTFIDTPVVSTYKPQVINHQVVHQQEFNHVTYQPSVQISESSGYEYSKPDVKFEQFPIVTSTYKPQVVHQHVVNHVNNYQPSVQISESSGYEYSKPEFKLEQTPIVSSTYKPQEYNYQDIQQQEVNKVSTYQPSVLISESSGYEYSKPEIKFDQTPIVSTTYKPHVFNHQVVHQQEVNTYQPTVQISESSGYKYLKPEINVKQTPIVSTYKPQVYNHQVVHQQEVSHVKTYLPPVQVSKSSGYEYSKPEIKFDQTPIVSSTYKPQVFNHAIVHQQEVNNANTYQPSVQISESSGYEYSKPEINIVQTPIVSTTYKPQVYNHEVVHQQEVNHVKTYLPPVQVSESSGYEYSKPEIKFEQAPIVSTTYKPQVYNHKVVHQQEINNFNTYTPLVQISEYSKPEIQFEQTPIVSTTYKPQVYNHQVVHQQEVNHANAYLPPVQLSESSGYEYSKPEIKFEQAPIVSTTYKPQVYNHKVVHQQEINNFNTYTPSVQISEYSKPEIQFEQTPIVSTTYKPQEYNHQIVHKQEFYTPASQSYDFSKASGYEYAKPEIKYKEGPKTVVAEYTTAQPSFNANSYSHQTIHKVEQHLPISSTSKPYFQDKYEQPAITVYNNPLIQFTQKVTPAVNYVKPTYAPIIQQHEINHAVDQNQAKTTQFNQNLYSYPEIQKNIEYNTGHQSTSQVYHNSAVKSYENKNKDVVYVSTTPSQLIYEDHYSEYEPKKIKLYKAPEYIPPKENIPIVAVSTESPVNSAEDQYDYTHYNYEAQKTVPTQQASFPTAYDQPKQFHSLNFNSQVSSTYKPSFTPEIQIGYQAEEYLPPVVSTPKPVITTFKQTYLPSVSTTQATTFSAPDYLPPKVNTYLPPSTTFKPIIKSTTEPTYKYEESTPVYKAPEYLPPQSEYEPKVINFESFGLKTIDNSGSKLQYNPYQGYDEEAVVSTTTVPKRKQNIVIQTAKSNLLGFGTVGPDAGLLSTAYTPAPTYVTSTYTPIKQEFVEVTPSPIPVRRTKPKIAVVTKINDFNPLLVRKLGAVCSCQSPVLVLKGKKPNVSIQQDYVDYDGNDYDDSGRGDIGNNARKAAIQSFDSKHVTASPIVSSSFNPIIVPDDSFYQDSLESDYQRPKEVYSGRFVSSSPATETIVKIRPRTKAVTIAPTYKTVLVKESVTPTVIVKDSEGSIESQSFDRYGPGGWRSRDETLQGSVDCQRAGLFRHPKQCNKFYACRWDTTKQRFTLHVFNCPVQLSFDPKLGACNWPSQGPACQGDTLLTNSL